MARDLSILALRSSSLGQLVFESRATPILIILKDTDMFFDRGNHYEFLSLGQELAAPGDLQHPQTFDFNFKNVEKQYESYNGINVKLRYFVRVTVSRRMADVIREKDIWVYSYRIPPETNSSIKMDVGIEDCLHIEFEYSKSKYHLKDVIVGRIYFLLVRLKIKHMELSIIRRETTGVAPNQYNESETLVRFEVSALRVMDTADPRILTQRARLWMARRQEVMKTVNHTLIFDCLPDHRSLRGAL